MWSAFPFSLLLIFGTPAAGQTDRKEPLNTSEISLQERADAAAVKLFMAGSVAPPKAQAIAEIYGLSCARHGGQTDASADDALNQLKIKAVRSHANAVVSVALQTGWQPNPLLRRHDIKCSEYVVATGIAVSLSPELSK